MTDKLYMVYLIKGRQPLFTFLPFYLFTFLPLKAPFYLFTFKSL